MRTKTTRQAVQSLIALEQAFGVEELPITMPQRRRDRSKHAQFAQLAEEARACTACSLYRTRTQLVFGEGSPHAQLVFVGEAPGREEDQQGRPFVGAAGQLLTKMIEAIGLKREDVYICNVLKDRPPNNRPPQPEEIAACRHWLEAQLEIIQPRIICTLGKYAALTLLGAVEPITQLRGTWTTWHGIALMPTLHPAYLLRNPEAKKLVWQDLKRVRARLTRASTR